MKGADRSQNDETQKELVNVADVLVRDALHLDGEQAGCKSEQEERSLSSSASSSQR